MFTVSTLILGFLFFLSKVLPAQNTIGKKLSDLDYKIIILSQFFSIAPVFFFNFPIITQRSYQESFIEKINLTLQNLLFIFSAFVSCLIIFVFDVTSKNKEEKKKPKNETFGLSLWFSMQHYAPDGFNYQKHPILFSL